MFKIVAFHYCSEALRKYNRFWKVRIKPSCSPTQPKITLDGFETISMYSVASFDSVQLLILDNGAESNTTERKKVNCLTIIFQGAVSYEQVENLFRFFLNLTRISVDRSNDTSH